MTQAGIDFGYPFWLNYGHLCVTAAAGAALVAAFWFGSPIALRLGLAALVVWAVVSATIAHVGIAPTRVPSLPTGAFLVSGGGRVLDVGAGTGRSSLMVLTARPRASVVASDLFSSSFERHFGDERRPIDRLRRNLEAAGVSDRATIEVADMRALPFTDATFDAVVSAYAMDHIGREGADAAVREAHRVLRPGGEFLLIVVNDDWWGRIAFGPLLAHGNLPSPAWWREVGKAAGFRPVESGTRPITSWFLFVRDDG